MTNQEAIEILKKYKDEIEEDYYVYYVKRAKALDRAIEALKLQSSFINELKSLKGKTESYLNIINNELDWFGENK